MRMVNRIAIATAWALSCVASASMQQAAPPQPPAPGTAPAGTVGQGPGGGAPAGQPGQPGGRQGGRGGGIFRRPDPIDFNEHDGWISLFDGRTLNGWSGDNNWKVEDGAIVVESSCENPTGTIYLVWQGGEAADFELKLEMKGTGMINGGVQYRGWIAPPRGGGPGGAAPGGGPGGAAPNRGANAGAPASPAPAGAGAPPAGVPAGAQAAGGGNPGGGGGRGPQGPCPSGQPRGVAPSAASEAQWNMAGAQYDFDAPNQYTGQLYEQATGRGIIAWKGQVVRTMPGDVRKLVATLGDDASVNAIYKPDDWNELHIIAVGNQVTHLLNGRVISMTIDEDTPRVRKSGILGLEVEATGKLFTRNIWLKRLP